MYAMSIMDIFLLLHSMFQRVNLVTNPLISHILAQ